MKEHLPVLQVILPLMAAPFCVLLRRPRIAWALAFLSSVSAFSIALFLLHEVTLNGVISYAFGGWAVPWGIEYRVDILSAWVLLIVSGISTLTLLFARESVAREVDAHSLYLFYSAWVLCVAGLLGIAITGDVFNLFVFLEISSLSSYVLISFGHHRRALVSAYRYLVMGTIGATFIVIGIGFLYVMTGTLNMVDLANRLPAVASSRTIAVAFAFLTVGISLKVALFPLHAWLPDAYSHAPSAVSALLAATATKVGVYALLRFLFTIFGGGYAFVSMALNSVLMFLALAAILMGSVTAIFQIDLKRMLAFSSIAQIGYMVLGVSFASVTGLSAGILHLFNHALMKAVLFMALGCVFYRLGAVSMEKMAGLGRRMPWTMAAFVVGSLSLIGVPLSVGFISKWYLISAALEVGLWPVVIIIVAASLLAVVYLWRVVEMAYFSVPPTLATVGNGARDNTHDNKCDSRIEAPLTMLIPIWMLIVANVYFGINATWTTGLARQAAETLLGINP